MKTVLGIIVGLLIISIMMALHEWGHYVAGRLLKFKILSYNIFMGPTLFKKRKNGIDYTIKSVPIGASVEFAGELEDDEAEADPDYDPNDPGLFFNRPRWARAIVAFSGPLMNFISAFIALVILVLSFGTAIPTVAMVPQDSAFAGSGIEAGDRIISYNDSSVNTVMDYQMENMFSEAESARKVVYEKPNGERHEVIIRPEAQDVLRLGISYSTDPDSLYEIVYVDPASNGGDPVLHEGDKLIALNGASIADDTAYNRVMSQITSARQIVTVSVDRDGQRLDLPMTLTEYHDVEPMNLVFGASKSFGTAIHQGFHYQVSVIKSTFRGLGWIFKGKLSAREGLAGPVAIVGMVGDVVKEDTAFADKVAQLLMFFAFVSVAIGFTNLLPIPPLDGHHLLILAIEGTIRRDLPTKFKHALAMVGFILIFGLAILVFYFDITRLFAG